ncbi:fructose-bisphosphatase class II family protein [Candidatus Methylacidithermus pantelleriae]|uniref:Fructose-1,6-bisphosphatase n=1 Tax=Candidatus Methylacidithermus pantelleriae TaxID=2744239 RepID=A0A8J2BIU9_9BACT|nr:fructose-bisphosphatase class II family protein [Candidatus Methylacidithermus pantelleriae]CAF0695006.1 Fructose-1,6-bisphosphatase [Candidatus Methylacidithermus pantelleriae]
MESVPSYKMPDLERVLAFDFVRATEAAALNVIRWVGKGEKEKADAAACDAIRGMFDLMDICAEVVIGEGLKDEAPGIFKGEKLGRWIPGSPRFDIAVDPIDGTTNVSKGLPGSLAVIAAAVPEQDSEHALKDLPSYYAMKLAYGPQVKNYVETSGIESFRLDTPVEELLPIVARALRKRLSDLVVCVMDRPRHAQLIAEIRKLGCSLRLIEHGDITAAMAPSLPDGDIDLYIGIGGAPEAVLAAAGIRCLGGEIQVRMWPKDEKEKQKLIEQGYGDELDTIFYAKDLAKGSSIIFSATAISDAPGLPGVRIRGNHAVTHSVLMRSRTQTVRYIRTHHNLQLKTIRLRSSQAEHTLANDVGTEEEAYQ